MFRRAAVDDHVGHAALRGQERKGRRRINRKRGTESDDEVRLQRALARAFQLMRIKTLAEADRGRLQEPAAFAKRRGALRPKKIEVRLRIAPALAALAFDKRIGAMQLNQSRRARSREAVQASIFCVTTIRSLCAFSRLTMA